MPPDQLDAALQSTSRRVCVISAPGSGKTTRVLLPKIRALVNTGTDPSTIILLTFSRVSAIDLRNKVDAAVPGLKASTVHSLALAFLLSENNHAVRDRVDTILMDFEKPVLISDLRVALPGVGRRELNRLFKEFSAGWATTQEEELFEENEARRRFKAVLLRWLREHHAATMEEVMYHAVRLAQQLPEAPLIDEPQYILVDEYQDLNKLEQQLIEQLARRSQLLLIVGDPDQSIYSFKYAHPTGIDQFAAREDVATFRHGVTLRCPRLIAERADQLLEQITPGRPVRLTSASDEAGEIHFVRRNTQPEEFEYVIESIANRLRPGVGPSDIVVLTPRKDLGDEFVRLAAQRLQELGLQEEVKIEMVSSDVPSTHEQIALLKLGLLARPNSILRARVLLGLEDSEHFAEEFRKLRERYGNIENALNQGDPEDFGQREIRLRRLCAAAQQLRRFVQAYAGVDDVDRIINEILPEDDPELAEIRTTIENLYEVGDSISTLYQKYIEDMRTVPSDERTIRVMTLRSSKGLGVDHVYVIGCNSGNIPGANYSTHLTDREHFEEQGRLLYVAFTRAQKSLTVTWSRHIPYAPALRQRTGSIATRRIGGELQAAVGLSELLQDLPRVQWE